MRFGTAIALLALPVVTACGGGGSPSAPPPQPNAAPVFTSGTAPTLVENATAVFRATATDANNDTITFKVSGGADASLFTIAANGDLSFRTAPNYELPGDADGDNVYEVELSASDGRATARQSITVTVLNSREGIAVRRVGTGFTAPVGIEPLQGSDEMLVLEKGGDIYRFDPTTGSKTLHLTVLDITTDGERGLLSVTQVPQGRYGAGRLLVLATFSGPTVQLREYHDNGLGAPSFSIIASVPHPNTNIHNGGWIGVAPDDSLYVTIGDGGTGGDPAQDPNSGLGKVLRLIPNPDPYAGASPGPTYVAAPGNPYYNGGGDPFVFAMGLRNPFRASIDDGRLYIGDVGQNDREEIDILPLTQPGLNFGWPFLEGTRPYSGNAPAGLTAPVAEYGHGSGRRQGGSVIGGHVYRGPIPELTGRYIFGDFISQNIWSVPAASLVPGQTLASSAFEWRNADFAPDAGTIDQLVSFGVDRAGNLFIVDLDGEIFMVVRA